jgi:hypothetical protein
MDFEQAHHHLQENLGNIWSGGILARASMTCFTDILDHNSTYCIANSNTIDSAEVFNRNKRPKMRWRFSNKLNFEPKSASVRVSRKCEGDA